MLPIDVPAPYGVVADGVVTGVAWQQQQQQQPPPPGGRSMGAQHLHQRCAAAGHRLVSLPCSLRRSFLSIVDGAPPRDRDRCD
jgi:hypothetical protein|eukprot:COSAG01_NODE_8099_length_2918_cov_12.778959_3_plen_83_part_00